MRAMVLEKARQPLVLRDVLKPKPKAGQLLVRVSACAVCRTDLHIVDGELPDPKLPLILGHQIVGRVEKIGEGANPQSLFCTHHLKLGDLIVIPWLCLTDC
jgi:propanol-preferring alcohol dehydrogenase